MATQAPDMQATLEIMLKAIQKQFDKQEKISKK